MPISKEQFDAGVGNVEMKIINHLIGNPLKAYSLKEISKEFTLRDDQTILAATNLQIKGAIKLKYIGTDFYIIINNDY